MESLLANRPLLYSLLVSASAVVALGSGLLPEVMSQFQLVDFDAEVSLSRYHTCTHTEVHLCQYCPVQCGGTYFGVVTPYHYFLLLQHGHMMSSSRCD